MPHALGPPASFRFWDLSILVGSSLADNSNAARRGWCPGAALWCVWHHGMTIKGQFGGEGRRIWNSGWRIFWGCVLGKWGLKNIRYGRERVTWPRTMEGTDNWNVNYESLHMICLSFSQRSSVEVCLSLRDCCLNGTVISAESPG